MLLYLRNFSWKALQKAFQYVYGYIKILILKNTSRSKKVTKALPCAAINLYIIKVFIMNAVPNVGL